MLEYCERCDQPTGKAGAMEDSIFYEGVDGLGIGPLCDDCDSQMFVLDADGKAIHKDDLAELVRKKTTLDTIANMRYRVGRVECTKEGEGVYVDPYTDTRGHGTAKEFFQNHNQKKPDALIAAVGVVEKMKKYEY